MDLQRASMAVPKVRASVFNVAPEAVNLIADIPTVATPENMGDTGETTPVRNNTTGIENRAGSREQHEGHVLSRLSVEL